MTKRPKFLPSFLEGLKQEAEKKGIAALVPAHFIAFAMVSSAIAYLIPVKFWSDWEVVVTVYAGILTFNALVLTLGWTSFSRVHDIIVSKKIGTYLLNNNLLNDYLLQISFMHFSQTMAAITSGLGLVFSILEFRYPLIDLAILTSCATFTMHGLKQALDSVEMMNDLVWQSVVFENQETNQPKGGFHAINGGKE